uniref:Post-GPI attachment to proteins factor 2 n=2 Tax=Ascaris TaxID=6251 RepID=A0A0M3IRM7_ASCLU
LTVPFCKDHFFQYHDRWASFGVIPLFIGLDNDRYIYYNGVGRVRLPVRWLTDLCCSLPLIALFICILLALETDFERATRTHCGVPNILPSISVAIGDFQWGRIVWKSAIFAHLPPRTHCGVPNILPSISVAIGDFQWGRIVWKSAIFAHLPPRIIVAFAYSQIFRVPFERFAWRMLRHLTCVTYLTELFSLGLLSAVTSNHNHPLHVFAFTTFQVSALVHMMLHLWMYSGSGIAVASKMCRKSYRYKRRFLRLSILLLFSCSFAYYRHNSRCEAYVYSLFALCEYLLVAMNVFFHGTFKYDFAECNVYLF